MLARRGRQGPAASAPATVTDAHRGPDRRRACSRSRGRRATRRRAARPPAGGAGGAPRGAVSSPGIKLSRREHTASSSISPGNRLAEAIRRTPPAAGLDADAPVDGGRTRCSTRCWPRIGADRAGHLRARRASALPGFVDHAHGARRSGRRSWRGARLPLAAASSERLGLPVIIDNDANLVTLAELWFGAGRELADFAVVTIEHGRRHGAGARPPALPRRARLGHGARPYQGAARRRALPLRPARLPRGLCRRLRPGARGVDGARAARATAGSAAGRPARKPVRRRRRPATRPRARSSAAPGATWRSGSPTSSTSSIPTLIILSGERMRYDYLYAADVLAEMQRLSPSTPAGPAARSRSTPGATCLGARGRRAGAVAGHRDRARRWPRRLAGMRPALRAPPALLARRRRRRGGSRPSSTAPRALPVRARLFRRLGAFRRRRRRGPRLQRRRPARHLRRRRRRTPPGSSSTRRRTPARRLRLRRRRARPGSTERHRAPIRSTSTATAPRPRRAARRAEPAAAAATADCSFTDATAGLGLPRRRPLVHRLLRHVGAGPTRLPTLAIGNYVDRDDPDGPVRRLRRQPASTGPRATATARPAAGAGLLRAVDAVLRLAPRRARRTCGSRTTGTTTSAAATSRCGGSTPLRARGPRRTAGSRSRSGAWASPAATSPATACPT